jgi:hypothetical protein
MNETPKRPSVDEMAELEAYLVARQQGKAPAPGQPGFPSGLAAELLELARQTHPDPVFATRLERHLQRVAERAAQSTKANSLSGRLHALWQTLTQPERKTAMKRLTALTLTSTLLLILLFVAMKILGGPPSPSEIALATPPTYTPAPASATPGAQTPISPTSQPIQTQPPLVINFTPQPVPAHPPILPSLAQAYGLGYGGGGGGGQPEGMHLSLAVDLPIGPAEMTAYYRLENTPMTMDQAAQLAAQWGLRAQLYQPGWMLNVTPEQVERSYDAIEGMQMLSIWNGELSFLDLGLLPSYGGHQYPPADLPPAEQALEIATQYLAGRGMLDYTYQADLRSYNYGTVNFCRLLDGWRLVSQAAYVTLDPQGQVGAARISLEDYQPIGSYPVLSAQEAWSMLQAGEPSERLRVSYYTARDRNPQYWGRVYQAGESADLFGPSVLLTPVDLGAAPYIQMGNLILTGDLSALVEHLQSSQGGYIHAWGQVQEVDGERQLLLSGWETFDEFSGYFDGTVRRTAEGDFLELSDGRRLRLPVLPTDVPADIPLYAQGGVVGDTLEWFILQVHPWDEGQMPSDLSQASAVIDRVELVYLAPDLSSIPPEQALDPSYRMLQPAWLFSGRITTPDGDELIYQAYVGAAVNP